MQFIYFNVDLYDTIDQLTRIKIRENRRKYKDLTSLTPETEKIETDKNIFLITLSKWTFFFQRLNNKFHNKNNNKIE